MALRLVIENEKQLPDGGPTSYTVRAEGEVEIGRAQYLDWVLPDPNKVVSNKHCEIRWKDGGYWLSDTSTNGTFLNGGEDRMRGSALLKNGDRIAIGHYIIAVSIEEVEPAPQRPGGLPKAIGLSELWADADAAPPIDPKLLRPREKVPRTNDFLDRVADLPWIDAPPTAPALSTPSGVPRGPEAPAAARQTTDADDDWLPRKDPATSPARLVVPEPVREVPPGSEQPSRGQAQDTPRPTVDRDPEPWMPVSAPPAASSPAAPPAAVPVPPAPPPPIPSPMVPAPVSAAGGDVLARFAKGLGIAEGAFAGRNAGDIAEDIGRLVRLVAVHVKALLDDRQQAKRAFRVSNHTMIAAFENNPLKFQPTVDHALAIMFGPPNENYRDARSSFEEAFKDLAEHQILTLSAMQKAVQLLEKELAPDTIQASVEPEKGLAAIVGWTHARFWDAYVHRWDDRTKYHGDGLNGAFMRDFAKCYDDLQKGSS